jgi:hypothetical protein
MSASPNGRDQRFLERSNIANVLVRSAQSLHAAPESKSALVLTAILLVVGAGALGQTKLAMRRLC